MSVGRFFRHRLYHLTAKPEPLCDPKNQRDALFPLKESDQDIFEMYKEAYELFWSPLTSGVDFNGELQSWKMIPEYARKFLVGLLAFFVVSDAVIADNITGQFMNEFTNRSVLFFFAFQASMENTHNWTYSLMCDKAVPEDVKERLNVFNASIDETNFPCIVRKKRWLQRYTSKRVPLPERIIAFACAEALFFSSAFAGMFWIREQFPGTFPALTAFNSYIMKDENKHTEFAALLYRKMNPANRLSVAVVHEIISEAVDVETDFMRSIITDKAIGLDIDDMRQYIEFLGDILCGMLVDKEGEAVPPMYNVKNPYRWMLAQSLRPRENFFEYHVGEYIKSGRIAEDDECGKLKIDLNADI